MSEHRCLELDLWRGSAVIGMIVYHFYQALRFFGLGPVSYGFGAVSYADNGWLLFARLIQWSFLLLAGISLHLAYQRGAHSRQAAFLLECLKRGAFIFGCGMLVSLVTWIIVPDIFVRFGILHLIGVSIVLLAPMANKPLPALLLAVAVYLLGFRVQAEVTEMSWLSPFGFVVPGLRMLDYFPMIPWIGVPALGISLGPIVYQGRQYRPFWRRPVEAKWDTLLIWCGQHSLLIYLLHVPVLAAAILAFRSML